MRNKPGRSISSSTWDIIERTGIAGVTLMGAAKQFRAGAQKGENQASAKRGDVQTSRIKIARRSPNLDNARVVQQTLISINENPEAEVLEVEMLEEAAHFR